MKSETARVFLVGAGPGDPELLTIKAHRLITSADVVVYDRLVSQEILDMVPAGTARIFVGKASSNHTLPQDEINQLLLRLGESKHRVVRLKGGDPNIFGRGGEEADFLEGHGIACEVVPGVTAAAGCAAAARVPLTYRGLASGVRFVTGHRRDDGELDLDWKSLADPDTTLAVYMGLSTLPVVRRELIAAGLPAATPAVLIASGATSGQRVARTTLGRLPERAAETGFEAPVMTIIGQVAGLASVRETEIPESQPFERRRQGHG